METKKQLKISLSTFFLILTIIIIIMGYFIYNISEQKSSEQVVNDLQEKTNRISNTTIDNYITYSKNRIEFNYPSTFKQTNDTFNTSGFEAIEDENGNRFQIQDETIADSITLKDIVKREEELQMPDGTNYRTLEKSEEYITLANGVKGYKFESTTKDNAYQIIFITQKDNKVYQFTFTIENKLNNNNNNIEMANKIWDSLIIK